MSYQSVSLPASAANGPGTPVDMSAFGAVKTITVSAGGTSNHRPSITIEISNQAAPTKWTPVAFFQGSGDETVVVAARWMRANVSNFLTGAAPVIDVGGEDDGTSFATLVAPSTYSTGAGVDTSSLGLYKSVHVAGPFEGAVVIEVSQDGGATYSEQFTFQEPGVLSDTFAADFMRVSRNGAVLNNIGTPLVNIGACASASGGGGGGGTVDIEDGGSGLGAFSSLNFTGAGVTVTDGGGGTADIDIPGGSGAATSGGEAGFTGAGTLGDPLIPVAGPFRPVTSLFVFDDYMTKYPLAAGGETLAIGNTSILLAGSPRTFMDVNVSGAGRGPSPNIMLGLLELNMAAANAGEFISATQLRDDADSGRCIDLTLLNGNWDLWYDARVAIESGSTTGLFTTTQEAFFGFREFIDLSVIGTREGFWFRPKDSGGQVNWFAQYRIIDDNGVQTADIDTGVRMGFTAAHPASPRAAQRLTCRLFKHALSGGFNATLAFYIEGVLEHTVELLNPTGQVTPMAGIASKDPSESNVVYLDWMQWALSGRPV